MNIIEYDINIYKQRYDQEYLTGFNRGKLSKGPIEEAQTVEAIHHINKQIVEAAPNVSFKAEHIKPSLEGGACSVISLRIAQKVVEIFPQCNRYEDLVEKVTSITQDLDRIATKENTTCSAERLKLRSLQEALNTITLPSADVVGDFSNEKARAIAACYDLQVESSSEEIEIQPIESCVETITSAMDEAKPGVYFVRTLRRPDPTEEAQRKREMYGHSTLYIKYSKGREMYLEPNLGLFDLSKRTDSREILFQILCGAQVRYHLELCRFHKLEKNNKRVEA